MLPEVKTVISDQRSSGVATNDPANWFIAQTSERGRTDQPTLLRSMAEVVAALGARTVDTQLLHDSLEAHFRVGGRAVYFSRIVGPSATTATATAQDATPADAMVIDAISPGSWGSDVTVDITEDTGTFSLKILHEDIVVESSPDFTSVEEAVAWAATFSEYVTLEDAGNDVPTTASVDLVGGDSDEANITATEIAAALARLKPELGPGIVSLPGMTSSASHEALLAHAVEVKRPAWCDLVNTAEDAAHVSAASALGTQEGARMAGLLWPWVRIPGLAVGTVRVVPPSAIASGLAARASATGHSPGDPIAGELGETDYALGLSQEELSDASRETYNDAGITVLVSRLGRVRIYGNRTLTNALTDPSWAQFSQSRVVGAVAAIAEEVSQRFFMKKLDGRGFSLRDYGMSLKGEACSPFYDNGDLYGETPEEAFQVDVSDNVNPPQDLANGKLRARISLRTSPGADMITLEIVKVPTSEAL